MPSDERIRGCFSDIVTAVDLINDWIGQTGGVDNAVQNNVLVRSAIERQLLIISEAAIRLHKLDLSLAARLAPGIDWAGIRGIGNFIRHKYDGLDARVVADVLRNRLGDLRAAATAALAKLE